ncbi:hypothetical protein QBC35DRAFT_528069 [Podospora australis]|uniref:F-box domain-containing protein n=1 Tax=Podospora australis TaxID=1536484 RepID=A0AAN7AN54_9PEZI|nr:hypothetical protein QBC35DRAFT_528069 [Podospora australis]
MVTARRLEGLKKAIYYFELYVCFASVCVFSDFFSGAFQYIFRLSTARQYPYIIPTSQKNVVRETTRPPLAAQASLQPSDQSKAEESSQTEDSLQSHSPRTIENIPTELVCMITEYLQPEQRAALALASRKMLLTLGRATLELASLPRYRLLLRLEKDGVYPYDIVYPECRIFHHPFPSCSRAWQVSTDHRAMRACEQKSSTARVREARDDLDLPSLKDEWFIYKSYNDYLISSDGYLLRKTQRLMLPRTSKLVTTRDKLDLSTIFWNEIGPLFKDQLCNRHMTYPPRLYYGLKITCICDHSRPHRNPACSAHVFDAKNMNMRTAAAGFHASGQQKRYRSGIGIKVRHCKQCLSEFTIGWIDVPGDSRRACVVTSWKSIGGDQNLDGRRVNDTGYRFPCRDQYHKFLSTREDMSSPACPASCLSKTRRYHNQVQHSNNSNSSLIMFIDGPDTCIRSKRYWVKAQDLGAY